jgi:subtilase family serine protease
MTSRARAVGVGLTCLGLLVVAGGAVAGAAPHARMTPIPGSFTRPLGASVQGAYRRSLMSVEVVLTPRDQAGMHRRLSALYEPASASYHHWLARGRFARLYAPSAASRARVAAALRARGLAVAAGRSPFLMRATGSSAQVQRAFGTTILRYRSARGTSFHANASPIEVPSAIAADVQGVVGLTNTVRLHPAYVRTSTAAAHRGQQAPRYGAGPLGSGLSPQQVRSLYGAGAMFAKGPRGQGRGTVSAVFELSGYTQHDITVFGHTFLGSAYTPPLRNINVDGGPIHGTCPKHDTCFRHDYSNDIEVVADIEAQLGMAPALHRLLVYNAPNDFTGQTSLDEYQRIASDDRADTVSTSWGFCEPGVGISYARAENVIFTQMAMQGQSITSSSGDEGAFDCLLEDEAHATQPTVDDPTSQPLVTSVGGTSFGTFDPGRNNHPSYPRGRETVWNPLNACSGTPSGLDGCAQFGAGGGGVSRFWPRPSYQFGPGVISEQSANGCARVPRRFCREVPDVSANADEFTPYAEYCTGSRRTNSTCVTAPARWFGIGGTSLSSPLWGAILADSVSLGGGARIGFANPALYAMLRGSYGSSFHDITGIDQTPNSNGLFLTTPSYDMATGIGSPRISAIAAALSHP